MESKDLGNISLGDRWLPEKDKCFKLGKSALRKEGNNLSVPGKGSKIMDFNCSKRISVRNYEKLSQPKNNETLSWMPKGSCVVFTSLSFFKDRLEKHLSGLASILLILSWGEGSALWPLEFPFRLMFSDAIIPWKFVTESHFSPTSEMQPCGSSGCAIAPLQFMAAPRSCSKQKWEPTDTAWECKAGIWLTAFN